MDAGDFSSWLTAVRGAIAGDREADVPCDGCTACCTASQFIHIGPDETDALAHIPAELLFPAPGRPPGHALMGYDERGHCPMLVDDACTIYAHRPVTCRSYDCRIFPAAGVSVDEDDPDKKLIARRARQWEFAYATAADRSRHDAVRTAATFLGDHPEVLSDTGRVPNATQRAVMAIEIHEVFGEDGAPDVAAVRVEIRRRQRIVDRDPRVQ